MVDRSHAFGKERYSHLDNFIFSLRKNQIAKRLPASPNIIADFGSGYDCRLLLSLKESYPEAQLVGIDTEFDASLDSVPSLSKVVANLNDELSMASDSIDVALSLAVLEHLERPDTFLKEAYRVLKPGGLLLLTTPGPTSKPLLEFLAFQLKIIDDHEIRDHKHYFSSKELEECFAKAGFKTENIDAKTFIFGMNNVVKAIK